MKEKSLELTMKPTREGLLSTLFALGISLLAGIIIILVTSNSPYEAITAFFISPLRSSYFLLNIITGAIPLVFTGLAVAVAFGSGNYNLGLEGQVYISAIVGNYVAIKLASLHTLLVLSLVFIFSFLTGGLVAGFSGLMKKVNGTNELISSLLLGNAFVILSDYLVEGPFNDFQSGLAASPRIPENLLFTKIAPPSDLHTGIFFSLITITLVWLLLKHTNVGYYMKLTGSSPKFAFYSGIGIGKLSVFAMFISGGLAGLAGLIDLLGVHGRVVRGFSTGYGWNGIAVALIARNNPLLVLPAALLFSYLNVGAQVASFEADITPEISRIIQALIFFLITMKELRGFLPGRRGKEWV
ncbi:ABC transporter permease [Kosmotoga pacifica]|uniref:ABC transporter permease n=1 Tax=Kosmotoga pacifica TaxID=1330330 RepID=UPI001FDF0977|nr:ABC transporter permease [Kosmotoga pacifica]